MGLPFKRGIPLHVSHIKIVKLLAVMTIISGSASATYECHRLAVASVQGNFPGFISASYVCLGKQ